MKTNRIPTCDGGIFNSWRQSLTGYCVFTFPSEMRQNQLMRTECCCVQCSKPALHRYWIQDECSDLSNSFINLIHTRQEKKTKHQTPPKTKQNKTKQNLPIFVKLLNWSSLTISRWKHEQFYPAKKWISRCDISRLITHQTHHTQFWRIIRGVHEMF